MEATITSVQKTFHPPSGFSIRSEDIRHSPTGRGRTACFHHGKGSDKNSPVAVTLQICHIYVDNDVYISVEIIT